MATLTQVFARQNFSETFGTQIYAVPLNTEAAIVTNIIVVNTTPTPQTFTILFDGVELFSNTQIAGNATISIDLKQPIVSPSGTINGSASNTGVKLHMSGVRVI